MGKLKILCISAILSFTCTITSFAGQWVQNSVGWWYQNDNGSYPSNGWQWINDKCYYFNGAGYCLMNTTTPDGYRVNQNGEWVVNGVVQTAQTQAQGLSEYQKRMIKDSMEVLLYNYSEDLAMYPRVPIMKQDFYEGDYYQLLYFHLVSDASKVIQGETTILPYAANHGGAYWFDLNGTKELFKGIYGYSLSDSRLKEYMNVSNNRIGIYAGDPGSWTYLTINSTEISGDSLIIVFDYEEMSFADNKVVAAGQIAARFDKNTSSQIGYTFHSLWNYGLNPVL